MRTIEMYPFLHVIRSLIIFFFIVFSFNFSITPASAQMTEESTSLGVQPKQELFDGIVARIIEEKDIELMEQTQRYQKLEIRLTNGRQEGEVIAVENGDLPVANLQRYVVGDRVKVAKSTDTEGNVLYYITDYSRRYGLGWLFLLFVAAVLGITRWRGLMSLAGLGISFAVIFWILLPQILAGKDPVIVTILCSVLIIPATYCLSHGFNRKTAAAMIGTLIAMICTGILTKLFVSLTRLYGFASEEAGFLEVYLSGALDVRGLLQAGILIGALGVMDDITISQAAVVEQLHRADPKSSAVTLYRRAIAVGHDHIASLVNTLILVYTGASLPLFLLFVYMQQSFADTIDLEIVAEEVVRTLVGSIGLILAVPITTAIACWIVVTRKPLSGKYKPEHIQ